MLDELDRSVYTDISLIRAYIEHKYIENKLFTIDQTKLFIYIKKKQMQICKKGFRVLLR